VAVFIVEWPYPWLAENTVDFSDDGDKRACFAAKRDPSAAPTMRMIVPAAETADAVGLSVAEISVREMSDMGVTTGYPTDDTEEDFTCEGFLAREDEVDVAGPGTKAPEGITSASTPENERLNEKARTFGTS
jgi:hypothetical protein